MATLEQALVVKARVLTEYPTIIGAGIGRTGADASDCDYAVRVYLKESMELPDSIDGVPILPIVTGEIRAQDEVQIVEDHGGKKVVIEGGRIIGRQG